MSSSDLKVNDGLVESSYGSLHSQSSEDSEVKAESLENLEKEESYEDKEIQDEKSAESSEDYIVSYDNINVVHIERELL